MAPNVNFVSRQLLFDWLLCQRSTFESDKQRKIEYLLDYLEKYNEEIVDKNKFWKMVGLDEVAGIAQSNKEHKKTDKLDELLIRLGRNPRLWAPTMRPVSMGKLKQWMNTRESLKDEYWEQVLAVRVHRADPRKDFFRSNMLQIVQFLPLYW